MYRALKVLVLAPATREFLERIDPKALEQAERALEFHEQEAAITKHLDELDADLVGCREWDFAQRGV